jgi:hypothetical protein
MQLHYIDGSPFARIVRVLMREHGVECKELEIVEFPPPDTFLGLNPLGQVPVLVDLRVAYFPTRIAIDALLRELPLAQWNTILLRRVPLAAVCDGEAHGPLHN